MNNIDILSVIVRVLTCCMVIAFLFMITVLIIGLLEPKPLYYECIDYNGSPVRCTSTWTIRGITKGQTEDGRTLNLNSYKPIYKEDHHD